MENKNNVQKAWRTREQKQEIILQWQQSGKSRKDFCQEYGIRYNSLVGWCKQFRDQKKSTGFAEIKVSEAAESGLFAQVHLSGGIKIDFYQRVPADYFQLLIER